MQRVVFEDPYEFIPPVRHSRWVTLCTYILKTHLKRAYGIESWELKNADRFKASLAAGHSVLLCPNHSRPSDPLSMGIIPYEFGQPVYSIASWHVFKQSPFQCFMTRRLGGFSIFREGMDRASLNFAIDVLTTGERPLVIFPEGVITRCNEHLGTPMDGTAFIARTAAKKRAAIDPDKKVVVHPVGLRYEHQGDTPEATREVLATIEKRLAISVGADLPIPQRVRRCGQALLALKELDHIGEVQQGSTFDRLENLIEALLQPIETEWLNEAKSGSVVGRVKNVRSAILPDMVAKKVTEEERQRRWKQLANAYLAQQLSFYPSDYLQGDIRDERWLETVEQFEEDMTDVSFDTRPWKLTMDFGEAIEVSPKRVRGVEVDPLTQQIEQSMRELINDRRVAQADCAAANAAVSDRPQAKQSA